MGGERKENIQQLIKTQVIKCKSFSKINLGLWIKEKRLDGFHEIETIFYQNDSLYDEIEIKFKEDKKSDINLSFIQQTLNELIPLSTNSAYAAASLFFKRLGVAGLCDIKINKNIPLEAGLGGGSSNAASVLLGLNQIFNYPLQESELLILANKIGSDVPFFILGNTCLGKGKGEVLEKLENKLNLEIKIVKPKTISISTQWAYDQIDSREFIADHKMEMSNLILAMRNKDHDLFYKNTFNDFEMITFSFYPELIKKREILFNEGYKAVGLCGSGSALYGVKEKK